MEIIVAVFDDWGIGKDGTQPVALSADRKFFRETTKGAMVIVGRRTLGDFPGGKPLPARTNVVLSRSQGQIPGAILCRSTQEAVALAKEAPRAFVIGGGSVYKALLPHCDRAYITKIHITPESDTFFENLDQNPDWEQKELLASGQEDGISYEMLLYTRKNR